MATHSRKTPSDPNLRLRIELAMLRKHLSGTDLATAVGRTPGAVSHWLSGRYEPPRSMISKLVKALGVSPEWLMGHDLTEEQKERERRYLRRLLDGGEELDRLLEEVSTEELLRLLRRHVGPQGRSRRPVKDPT